LRSGAQSGSAGRRAQRVDDLLLPGQLLLALVEGADVRLGVAEAGFGRAQFLQDLALADLELLGAGALLGGLLPDPFELLLLLVFVLGSRRLRVRKRRTEEQKRKEDPQH